MCAEQNIMEKTRWSWSAWRKRNHKNDSDEYFSFASVIQLYNIDVLDAPHLKPVILLIDMDWWKVKPRKLKELTKTLWPSLYSIGDSVTTRMKANNLNIIMCPEQNITEETRWSWRAWRKRNHKNYSDEYFSFASVIKLYNTSLQDKLPHF